MTAKPPQLSRQFSLKKLSIQKKLVLIIMGITSVVLLSSLGLFISIELNSLKNAMLEDLSTLADLVGKNSSGAIMFYDSRAAEDNLQALKATPHIVTAHLLTDKNVIFAHYIRENLKLPKSEQGTVDHMFFPNEINIQLKRKTEAYFYINGNIHLVKPVIFEQDKSLLGMIYIESDREIYWQRMVDYIYTIIVMMGIALGLTLLFAFKAQKIFTAPILDLLGSMQRVSINHDYTNLLVNRHHDEFGQLIDGFNEMLVQLEEHEQVTKSYQQNLEKNVEERTAQLQNARDKALSASRTKSIFLANMSHEIRTPMNAILGYTQLLQQAELSKEQSSYLGIIDKSGKHLLGLINDILELSKIEAGTLEIRKSDFDLLELVNNIENMFKIACERKNIYWEMHCFTHKPVLVNGDKGKLNQILINIIGNACKFTDRGEILFTIEHLSDRQYQFTIKDTGIGIETQALDRIFDAFHQEQQNEHRGRGTGLGLNISKRHIELMSGKIKVSSQLNQGSIFTFDIELLPASESTIINALESRSLYTLKPGQALSALVVDDIEDNVDLLSSILRQMGLNVVCAYNGREALDEIEKNRPDIVFMDIRMPVMDGVEALLKIRQQLSSEQLKCIAVSAGNMRHQADYFISKGFNLFISKPFRFDEIYYAITDILGVELQPLRTQAEQIKDNLSSLENLEVPELKLKQKLCQKLIQAAEYGQLTELGSILIELKEYGQAGEMAAEHLESLIRVADLSSISTYVKELINE
ncbi:MAG: response regulator [gamma proteobacterium symbiont of Taylorina sp.]|nr:response regulator [gamma proteobacterium symbiont of Taylorina sp.]